MSSRKRVVVVGSSFAGMTAALEVRKLVKGRHEIVIEDLHRHARTVGPERRAGVGGRTDTRP